MATTHSLSGRREVVLHGTQLSSTVRIDPDQLRKDRRAIVECRVLSPEELVAIMPPDEFTD